MRLFSANSRQVDDARVFPRNDDDEGGKLGKAEMMHAEKHRKMCRADLRLLLLLHMLRPRGAVEEQNEAELAEQ